jgi:hypothetical protein
MSVCDSYDSRDNYGLNGQRGRYPNPVASRSRIQQQHKTSGQSSRPVSQSVSSDTTRYGLVAVAVAAAGCNSAGNPGDIPEASIDDEKDPEREMSCRRWAPCLPVSCMGCWLAWLAWVLGSLGGATNGAAAETVYRCRQGWESHFIMGPATTRLGPVTGWTGQAATVSLGFSC